MDTAEEHIGIADYGLVEGSRSDQPARGTGIETVDSLRDHLQWAIELELSTLPSYLCALYSLDPARNAEATEVLLSVFVEEMLHTVLAANALNAVGGSPQFDTPRVLQPYPRYLPHSARSFKLHLLPFGTQALDLFLNIEQPAPPRARSETDGYETIGQFYAAIEEGLVALCARLGEANLFNGDPRRQLNDFSIHGGARRVRAVDGLATALLAMDEIVAEGEGAGRIEVWDGEHDMFHPEREDVGHYYRLQQLRLGRRYRRGDTPESGPTGDPISIDWDGIRPMRPNQRIRDHSPGCPIRIAQDKFNQAYRGMLQLLGQAFNGRPAMLGAAIKAMFGLKAKANALMEIPTHDGRAVAGPTFEYTSPDE